ncbi:MAG TPA: regulatory protein RecX [Thermoanaerobaculia bacterium]
MTSCREAALAYLARRALARRELERKLRRKGFDAAEVEQVLNALTAAGLVDDAATSEALARSRTVRGVGRNRIAFELRSRGLGRDDIDGALAKIPAEDERAALRGALDRKARTLPVGLTPAATSKKLFDHLVRRGFSVAAVLEALRKKGESPDDP